MYSWHIYLRLDHLPLKPDENSVSFACSVDTDSLCWNLGSFQKQAQKPVQKQELQSITTFFCEMWQHGEIIPLIYRYEHTLWEYDFG